METMRVYKENERELVQGASENLKVDRDYIQKFYHIRKNDIYKKVKQIYDGRDS